MFESGGCAREGGGRNLLVELQPVGARPSIITWCAEKLLRSQGDHPTCCNSGGAGKPNTEPWEVGRVLLQLAALVVDVLHLAWWNLPCGQSSPWPGDIGVGGTPQETPRLLFNNPGVNF